MNTGPRFGDIYLKNEWAPGTSEWYEVEANNAKYRENQNYHSEVTPENMLFANACSKYKKESLKDFLNKFSK